VPASDASGTIVKVGGMAAAKIWREGDRVLSVLRPNHLTGPTGAVHHASGIGIPQPGVLIEYRVFPATGLVALPDYMTHEEGCTLPIAATTAWMALNWDRAIGHPRQGDKTTVLLQGTGGVCIAALQQSKALGLKGMHMILIVLAWLILLVIITSSSDAKLQQARDLGADHVINYKETPDWAREVISLTNGIGADIIIETGGPATLDQSLQAVAEGGCISAVGVLTGVTDDKPRTAIGLSLINRNATLKGINVGPRDRMEEMLCMYASKQIHPVIDRTFKFKEIIPALCYIKNGIHIGKIVIEVDKQ
jgi:NADPH:quinone reductase-like Zn-dependent oxidoreductase